MSTTLSGVFFRPEFVVGTNAAGIERRRSGRTILVERRSVFHSGSSMHWGQLQRRHYVVLRKMIHLSITNSPSNLATKQWSRMFFIIHLTNVECKSNFVLDETIIFNSDRFCPSIMRSQKCCQNFVEVVTLSMVFCESVCDFDKHLSPTSSLKIWDQREK